MRKVIQAVAKASWWQVGFLLILALVSFLDATAPRVIASVILIAFTLLIVIVKLVAGGNDRLARKSDDEK